MPLALVALLVWIPAIHLAYQVVKGVGDVDISFRARFVEGK